MYIMYIIYFYVTLIFFMQYSISNIQLEVKHIQVSY